MIGGLLALWAASSCNQITGAADIEIEGCTPGSSQQCRGDNGCMGTQSCDVDGSRFRACDCSGGTGGNAGDGNGGSGNAGSGNTNYFCRPLNPRPCTVLDADCTGTQSCRLDGSGYAACECVGSAGQGGASGSPGTGGSDVIPPECGADGATCTVSSDCCGGIQGPGICGINGVCGTACLPNAACPGCCAALFEQKTNAFLYRVCAEAAQCAGIANTSPIGVPCGSNSQCVGGNDLLAACVDDYGFCSAACLSTLECGPSAGCASEGKNSFCLPLCVSNADCAPFGLSCLSLPTIEGGTALMCAEGV